MSGTLRTGIMQDPYVKSATRGLVLGHVLLGLASGAALVLFVVLAVTQAYALVVIFPAVALALFTMGMLYLLQKDANERRANGEDEA